MEGDEARHSSGVSPSLAPELRELSTRVADLEVQVARLTSAVWKESSATASAHPAFTVSQLPASSRVLPPPLPRSAVPLAQPPDRPSASPPSPSPEKSLEDRIGSQVFNLIGMVALIFGAAWALKLAIEHGLVTPTARVVIGLLAGAAAILGSEVFRRRGMPAFSYSLKAVGTAVLYLSLWAAFQLYAILSAPVALVGMILITAWNVFMALAQDAQLLAGYALLGALLTPLLLSTGGDHETFLFTYLAAIDLGVVVLLRFKPWPVLLIPTWLATTAYFIGYYVRFFHPYAYGQVPGPWDLQSTETACFAFIFFALFALVSMRFWTSPSSPDQPDPGRSAKDVSVLLPLANATFIAAALYSVFQDSGLHASLAWLMLALAALFLGLMRLQGTSIAAAMHLASAIVFLSIAIPLKVSGQTLTTAWLVEGLVLYWAATRLKAGGSAPTRVLGVLATAAYALGLASVFEHWTWSWAFNAQPAFFNANLGSALVAVCALAGAVWLALPPTQPHSSPVLSAANQAVVIGALSAIDFLGLLLAARELSAGWTATFIHAAFTNADFASALVGLVLFAATSSVAWHLSNDRLPDLEQNIFGLVACIDSVLFNLIAILTVECEISSLWPRGQADLQRSLAISGFLMLYGALLLAIGFWRRSAFVRWQALVLILFTIAKVFLYDISGLSAGYRVASFLALGALLMTISFAYQKDWLSLKTAAAAPEEVS